MRKFLWILVTALVFVFYGCINTPKVIEQPVEEEIAQTEAWSPPPQVRVRVRIADNSTVIVGYQSGIRDDGAVYQIIKAAYLNHPFRTRTGNQWWLSYFPAFNDYKTEVRASDIVLVAWNKEAGKLTIFDDGEAMNWLLESYVSSPLWIKSQYAGSTYDKRRAHYLAGKWRDSHKKPSSNHLYVLKRMVNF